MSFEETRQRPISHRTSERRSNTMSRQSVEELLTGLGTATESESVSGDPFEGLGLQDAPSVVSPHPLPVPPAPLRRLRHGCYLVNYTPSGPLVRSYDGTMRV